MKALTFHGPRSVRVERVDDPELGAPGDVIVQVELSAVCGSDLHVWRGHETGLDAGTVLGHEFLGQVIEVGRGVERFTAGTTVVAPFTTSCGACFYCREGLTCRCSKGQLFGWVERGTGLHGAQAEYVRVPLADTSLLEVPPDVPREQALLCGDVLSTGLFCAEAGDVRPGSVVAVIGCGPVGLMAIVGAREHGAERVLALDMLPERLSLAARLGAEPLDASTSDSVSSVRDSTDGRGADCVLEAVGSPAASRLAVDLVRPGGTISACGVHTERQFAFSPGEAYDKNLTYRAGRCPARRLLPRALELVRSRRLDLGAIVSHRLPLSEAPRGYELFDRKLEGCTKVLLIPPGSGPPEH